MNEWTNKFCIKRVDEYDAITRRALRRIKLAKERKGPQRVENCRQMSRRCKERPRKRGEPTEAISIIVFNYRVARPPWLPPGSFSSRCCSVTKGSGTRATSVFSHDEKKKKRRTMQPETGFSGFSNAWHLARRTHRNTSATDVLSLSLSLFVPFNGPGLSTCVLSAC